ncbi:ATP-dependent helicase rhp16 [Dichanthelium oligosanthes]|uniref:ATP-dependent helicase rhp16 n=1 Tax=Dichanthelium oligosanthes TaxID=888268 RepID=A0A1E5WB40_9POAL|nr:ATP-dependent helicase rhp16 [Dichanthelium oligosanthes]
MPRRASGSGSGRRRRRDDEEDEDEGELPSDNTSDSDFVADSQDEAEDDDDDEGFAPDEDAPPAPAPAMAEAPPPLLMLMPMPNRARKGREKRRKRGKKARDEDRSPMPWQVWESANERWLDERAKAGGDGAEAPDAGAAAGAGAGAAVPTADPAPEVVLPLLRFQKEWLAWALAQEASVSRGGILADEMGMGKTIQAISLVLTARRLRPPGHHHSAASSSSSSAGRPKRQVGCTLVVCPVVAVIQWAEEIERHTASGSVRVLIYHGAKRGAQKFDFNSYDFIVTTYSTIEADYRKHIMPPKIRCEYCDKLFYPNKLKVHLKYFCGPDAVRTEKQAKQQSKKWGGSKGKVKEKRRGQKNDGDEEDVDELADEPVSQSRGQSPLHSVRWERIILDEAHFIKDRRCNTARAIFELESEFKWALSGTPLQNRVGELYSLDCSCEILDTRYVVAGTLMNNYAHIFDLLTRLRQAVDHPYLVAYSKTAEPREGLKNEGNESMESQCGICHNMAEDVVVTSCDHAFCKNCLIDYSATLGNVSCPSCSVPLTVDLTTKSSVEKVTPRVKGRKRSGILSRLASLADFKTSTKIDALREEIRNMIEHDGSAKGIVFSQFTSFLDLIEFSLEKSGIKCVQLNGAMNITEKGRAIDTFTNDPDCRIFLMSLKAGGVALNLTVASHWIYAMLDDRASLFSNYLVVVVWQEHEMPACLPDADADLSPLCRSTVGDSPDAMSKLTEADLKFLFQI